MSASGENRNGMHRVSDGSRVSQAEALAAWVPVARAALIQTAGRYNNFLTYNQLATSVQEVSGVSAGRVLLTNWIGKLLERVAIESTQRGEPPLTSLCVRQDGTIGDGYARAPKSVVDRPGEDIEKYAAEHRLLCYRRYAVDLPANGGTPSLTPAVAQRRSRRTSQSSPEPMICPSCRMSLPSSGVCDCA